MLTTFAFLLCYNFRRHEVPPQVVAPLSLKILKTTQELQLSTATDNQFTLVS